VLIVEFGSYAFSTVSLSADQWLWCLLFGCGELIWGQVSRSSHTPVITGPFTHSVGNHVSNGRWRLSSSVTPVHM